jgi:hypothetical protein
VYVFKKGVDDMPGIVYRLRVKGTLSTAWTEEFSGLRLSCETDGNSSLTGIIADQSALFGVLRRIRDLGLELISVNQIAHDDEKELQGR